MRTLLLCMAISLVAGCATEPRSDGGIVGTGNRPDCEEVRKDGTRIPAPPECKPERAAPR